MDGNEGDPRRAMTTIRRQLDRERRERELAMTPSERFELALALGARDVEIFRHTFKPPLSASEARKRLQRQKQASRTPSACVDALLS